MDQLKTGRFIAQMRKKKGLTQRELAEKLLISDKTVSKWECGNGMPEISLMLPLCETLGITVNELLTGEQLAASEYQKNAEVNIMKLMKEKEETKFRLIVEIVVVFLTLLSGCAMILIAGLSDITASIRAVLILLSLIVIFGGIGVAAALDMRQAVFECPKCKKRFMPTKTAYIMGMHTLSKRWLRCPHCGKKSWCKRVFDFAEEEEQ